MATVFQLIPAVFAPVRTGAIMSATTAGRMPRNMALSVSLVFIRSVVRKIAMARIIIKDGRIVPNAARTAPRIPRSLSPTLAEILTARIPGKDCATARRSRNSSRSSQLRRSTISFSIMLIMAHPPPKVKAPILKNDRNSCQLIFFITGRKGSNFPRQFHAGKQL